MTANEAFKVILGLYMYGAGRELLSAAIQNAINHSARSESRYSMQLFATLSVIQFFDGGILAVALSDGGCIIKIGIFEGEDDYNLLVQDKLTAPITGALMPPKFWMER